MLSFWVGAKLDNWPNRRIKTSGEFKYMNKTFNKKQIHIWLRRTVSTEGRSWSVFLVVLPCVIEKCLRMDRPCG